VREDLAELQMAHIDLVLLHFPASITGGNDSACWKGLEAAHD